MKPKKRIHRLEATIEDMIEDSSNALIQVEDQMALIARRVDHLDKAGGATPSRRVDSLERRVRQIEMAPGAADIKSLKEALENTHESFTKTMENINTRLAAYGVPEVESPIKHFGDVWPSDEPEHLPPSEHNLFHCKHPDCVATVSELNQQTRPMPIPKARHLGVAVVAEPETIAETIAFHNGQGAGLAKAKEAVRSYMTGSFSMATIDGVLEAIGD